MNRPKPQTQTDSQRIIDALRKKIEAARRYIRETEEKIAILNEVINERGRKPGELPKPRDPDHE